jgi:helicase
MHLKDIKDKIPTELYDILEKEGIDKLRPSQEKAIDKGLFSDKNLLVCTPTASGKTLVAELAGLNAILKNIGKCVYIVPLKALAAEKFKEFKRKYGHLIKVGLSIGDTDSPEERLRNFDLILTTSEKLDSITRHHADWLKAVKVVVVDEIHLLNDSHRGPTLEILITLLKDILENVQLIGLSATIGNSEELAKWLDAELVKDLWRPVKLHQGIYLNGEIEFFE